VKSEPYTGKRPSVRVCVELKTASGPPDAPVATNGNQFTTAEESPFQYKPHNTLPVQGGLDPNKISGVGTNFGLLVHVLPGPNKQRAWKMVLF
jgi:hypothetical protein